MPQLAALLLNTPLVTAPMIAQELQISQQAAQNLIAELAQDCGRSLAGDDIAPGRSAERAGGGHRTTQTLGPEIRAAEGFKAPARYSFPKKDPYERSAWREMG